MTFIKKYGKGIRAFTIAELLVVITIIGILSSVVYVYFGNAKDSSRESQAQVEYREIALALELYYRDHGSYPNWPGKFTANTLAGGDWDLLQTTLAPYIKLPNAEFISKLSPDGRVDTAYMYMRGEPH